jgi:hypothetical protein
VLLLLLSVAAACTAAVATTTTTPGSAVAVEDCRGTGEAGVGDQAGEPAHLGRTQRSTARHSVLKQGAAQRSTAQKVKLQGSWGGWCGGSSGRAGTAWHSTARHRRYNISQSAQTSAHITTVTTMQGREKGS